MSVTIGTIDTFPNPKADKAQVLKIGEECMEVFSAWEAYSNAEPWKYENELAHTDYIESRKHLVDECADVLQATCNLLAALGVDDMRQVMQACRARNVERGRL